MKKFFVTVSLLFVCVFIGCAMTSQKAVKFHQDVKEDVYLDPYHAWSNNLVSEAFGESFRDISHRSITLKLINKKYRDVLVDVKCIFLPGETVFGEKAVTVGARDDNVFTVWGFARITPSSETVRCSITCIK